MKPRVIPWTAAAIVFATVGALLQTPAQPPRQADVTSLLPAGASLVLQATDFASVLGDWNSSTEKAKWLESGNYAAFSRSRLFRRLKEAYDEFAVAAGVPVDMTLVADIAGTASALAIYDIGKLEFAYITRLPAAKAMENVLWRTRGRYEPRQAAGTPFYVRVDPESKRVVAFGVRDHYLILATREDLVAGAIALVGTPGGSSVQTEGWFAQSVKAAAAPGDLRLVMKLDALVREPHFRSYWIQDNVSELKPFASAVSDLFRTPAGLREERVLVRAEEKPAAAEAAGGVLGEMARLVPDHAGLYRAWAAPSASDATTLIVHKLLAPGRSSAVRERSAPGVVLTGGVDGSQADLETRIDQEARVPRAIAYQTAALAALMGAAPLSGMLHVESTRAGSDGIFVTRSSVVVLLRTTDWPAGGAKDAIRAVVEPVWTKARLGMRWNDARAGAQTFSQLEGLEPIAVAERGRLLFVANDPALLAAMLAAVPKAPIALAGEYGAGFRHALERERFATVMRFIDHASSTDENREPMFFSENLVSLSGALSRVEEASIVARDARATVSQTLIYRIAR